MHRLNKAQLLQRRKSLVEEREHSIFALENARESLGSRDVSLDTSDWEKSINKRISNLSDEINIIDESLSRKG